MKSSALPSVHDCDSMRAHIGSCIGRSWSETDGAANIAGLARIFRSTTFDREGYWATMQRKIS